MYLLLFPDLLYVGSCRNVCRAAAHATRLDADFSGQTLTPGTYTIGAAAAANSPVELDCQGSQHAKFTFRIGGALSLNANTLLVNGKGDVNWFVDGAASLAAGVQADGDIHASGAINLGTDAHLYGKATARGALNIGTGATTDQASSES
jgi:hypothetical protein